ncbi:hypothetical protein A3844_21740 [Paenibacillus helianthi]|uniref:DUF3953 domain-containing protein n=1 Tax=Paenibacillus helianthi TaxID=1349432 RepID=A0ABX3EJD6_9BACL|nr:hypothetical protein [Paenibacillus helianthi]OKP83465.1 hypothetical protein A3844_21740 [Paenibacillus helianthi]
MLKGIRYFFSAAVIVFAILVFIKPNENVRLLLTSLSISMMCLFQAIETRAAPAKAGSRQYANYVLLLVASTVNLAASLYIFSSLF